MEYAISRVLELYQALLEYYRDLVKSDPLVSHDLILDSLEDPFTLIYLEFLQYVLGNLFNRFNTVFQSQVPLFYKLKEEVAALITTCARNFMEGTYIDETDAFRIDPTLEEHYLPINEVYLGKCYLKILKAFPYVFLVYIC